MILSTCGATYSVDQNSGEGILSRLSNCLYGRQCLGDWLQLGTVEYGRSAGYRMIGIDLHLKALMCTRFGPEAYAEQ